MWSIIPCTINMVGVCINFGGRFIVTLFYDFYIVGAGEFLIKYFFSLALVGYEMIAASDTANEALSSPLLAIYQLIPNKR